MFGYYWLVGVVGSTFLVTTYCDCTAAVSTSLPFCIALSLQFSHLQDHLVDQGGREHKWWGANRQFCENEEQKEVGDLHANGVFMKTTEVEVKLDEGNIFIKRGVTS
ncbi:hypothetical protein MANES_02G090550v8 [Manihot esculenta]|uniref:Uncharacterized protein n=1 Tax=Manihot esculenta TaxID=3983 RepID=A0ACB7I757_MANES|nr:hypothetical protein MANES_02G090550v8 [Manihot esculenta]